MFKSYLVAEEKVEEIMKEINGILAAGNRMEAERAVLVTHANRLDEATRKARELLDSWLGYIRKQIGQG